MEKILKKETWKHRDERPKQFWCNRCKDWKKVPKKAETKCKCGYIHTNSRRAEYAEKTMQRIEKDCKNNKK